MTATNSWAIFSPRRVIAFCAVDEDRRAGRLARAGQRDADVRVARFARTVDHAAHHRQRQVLGAGIADFPHRHLRPHVLLHRLRQFLEEFRRSPAASRACGHQRGECAQADCLQQLLGDDHFLGPRRAGLGRQRDADGVADAFLQQHRQRRGRCDDALAAHARFGQAKVQREIAALRQVAIHRDQLLHAADLRREDDPVASQADFDRALGRIQRGAHQRLAQHPGRFPWFGAQMVLVHQAGGQRLVERTPIDADAHRLVVLQRQFDDRAELAVAFLSEADVARIYPVFRQRLGASRLGRQKLVPVVVEVADDRNFDAHHRQFLDDARHRRGGLRVVHRYPHQFGSGPPQLGHLLHRAGDIRRVGVGHRLDDDRMPRADQYLADAHRAGSAPGMGSRFAHCQAPPSPSATRSARSGRSRA